jgi:hypothetical protein
MSTNVCYWMIIEWWVLLFWRFVVPVAPVVTPCSLCEYTQNDLVTVTYHSRSFKLKWFILFSFTKDFQQISSVQQHGNCRKAVSHYYGWHLLLYVNIAISIKLKYFMSLFTLCIFYCILKTGSPVIQMSHFEYRVGAKIWFYMRDLIVFSMAADDEGSAQSFAKLQGWGADVLVNVIGIVLSTVKWIVTNRK